MGLLFRNEVAGMKKTASSLGQTHNELFRPNRKAFTAEQQARTCFHWWPSSAVIILQLHKDNWCVPSVARVMWLAVHNKGDIRRLLGSLETEPKTLPQSTVQVENVVRVGLFHGAVERRWLEPRGKENTAAKNKLTL